MCPECDEYAVDLEIRGPAQLRRLVGRLQAAISKQRLRADDSRSSQEVVEQPDFVQLDLRKSIPDVMIYYMVCRGCGQVFKLQCESYHGSGGSWQCM